MTDATAVPVQLADLPLYHPGGIVLERCFRQQTRPRDRAAVIDEYKSGKYANALEFARGAGTRDPQAVRMFEFGRDADSDWCFCRGDRLFRAPLREAQNGLAELLVARVSALAADAPTIVETGCGYGFNLWQLWQKLPHRAYVGGDIAETAISLSRHLFDEAQGPRVELFDYYDEAYRLLEQCDGPVFVFTCHSIEQLPSAAQFLKALSRYAHKVTGVVHFEPVYELYGESLLGRLRRAHADSVNYNRDLLTLLTNSQNIVVQSVEPNVYGINPLNPTSIIHWTFR
jgi:SAM-dependent methyltransferase